MTSRWRSANLLILTVILMVPTFASAQDIQLSAEQQQMLNSLPPAQRQQALNAIRDLQSQSFDKPQSINEKDESSDSERSDVVIDELIAEEELKADARSRVVINFSLAEDVSEDDEERVNSDIVLRRLLGSHLFVLDESGVLLLPGLDVIPLLGLKEEDIERRLQAEAALSLFEIDARILGQEPIGVEALKPFGYDVFASDDSSFDSPSTGPVPSNYVLGPGDTVRVQLFGNVNGIYEFEVSRDGILNLPDIGPVTVAGLQFSAFREDINKRVSQTLIGTQVSVTMGPLRTIRVFVLGDVQKPGSYIVDGLTTVSGALFRSGGASEIGSLRDVQLKRNGRVVARLDFYDLLIHGDSSDDRQLQPGDVIFVPPIGNTIAIGGAVRRPAIYETRAGASIADAIKLAGGLIADAFGEGARLESINANRDRIIRSVDLGSSAASAINVSNGDTLLVPKILPDFDNAVVLSGHVHRPGSYAWNPGMRLSDLIGAPEELKAGADMHYILVRREPQIGKPIEVLSASLADALADRQSASNIALQARDQVWAFSLEFGRQRAIRPIIDELRRQATYEAPALQVEVGGNVRAPGVYPLEAGMRISDLLRAGGNLSEDAYALDAELTRYSVVDGETRIVDVFDVDLAGVIRGDQSSDLALSPYDYLSISTIPEWDSAWTVILQGEVRFPGAYRVKRGESLADLLQRAGGLTEAAFPEGAVFLRESLKKREQEQIELLARRLESDLTSLSLQQAETGGSDTMATGRALLDQLRNTEPVGRLVIDTRHLMRTAGAASMAETIELRNGDILMVPRRSQVVTVIGEIQQNTSHLYISDLSRNDYINLSGGLTRRADKGRVYVVRANGAVVVQNQSRWLGRGSKVKIRPGDTIVVPLDADRIRPLTFWTNVTQILYQGAIAVAAIKTFDN